MSTATSTRPLRGEDSPGETPVNPSCILTRQTCSLRDRAPRPTAAEPSLLAFAARFGHILRVAHHTLSSMKTALKTIQVVLSAVALGMAGFAAHGAIALDGASQAVRMSDETGKLSLRLSFGGKCILDQVVVSGRDVVSPETGVCSGIEVGGQWYTTRTGIPPVRVSIAGNFVTVIGIRFGGGGVDVEETWRFEVRSDRIIWSIERSYLTGGTIDETCFPGWDFRDMQAWTGALLGQGGVAWGKLFDAPNASYGIHTGPVTFWNREARACLRVLPNVVGGGEVAMLFNRQPSGVFSFNYSVTDRERKPKHGLSRFLRDRQDVWSPFTVVPGTQNIEYTIAALGYDAAYDRGSFKHFDGPAIREICHTIARIGAVDKHFHGSNGFYSDCAVLHEPWIAQLGLAIDDPAYFQAYADTLDFEREHAIAADGRVKSRWAGTSGDAMPGTYDQFGFYEAQWGYLMDSQPSWVMNVAELFDFTGDVAWLQRQKSTCERVLDYLLRRDTDGNGLLEMATSSERDARGSDWLDVIWASHENALVNAQMYGAMTLWANLEEVLGDKAHRARYQLAAQKLKARFNQTTAEGGFWDATNQCYAYWRDKNGSVHGTNLVIPVNFSAIGYGVCDDPARSGLILDRIEALMQQQHLFFWPLCFFPYSPGEANSSQYPFPTYENGDLFLAWGELGTRAYARHNPAVPLKYVKSVLDQYAQDGLAFQRYLRKSQTGTGNDILANNSSIIVGLYRNIYGVQPKYNRLYLEPHLSPELAGTQLKYWLRDRTYVIDLDQSVSKITVDGFTVSDPRPFAVNVSADRAEYFSGERSTPSLIVTRSPGQFLELRITSWSSTGPRKWSEIASAGTIEHTVWDLPPNASYTVTLDGSEVGTHKSDGTGRISFELPPGGTTARTIEIRP